MPEVTRHILFLGVVQGVGFRFTARRIAQRYELVGFVRNCPDGRVEMLVQGPAENITDCLQEIQRAFVGYIRNTKIEGALPETKYNSFEITF